MRWSGLARQVWYTGGMPNRILLLCTALAMAGCAAKPRPPAFNLYKHQRLVVLPFENLTQDPALGAAIQDDLLVGLVRLNAVPVAEQAQVASMIQKLALHDSGVQQGEAQLRQRIADVFKCDLIMVGTISAYLESVVEEEPKRIKKSYKHKTFKWGYRDTASTNISMTVKLIDATTGNLLWIRKAPGAGKVSRWVDLPWPGEKAAPPAEGWDSLQVKSKGKKKAKNRKDRGETPPPAKPSPAGAAVAGQQPITIIINNTQQQQNTQTQTQVQTQQQAQAQAQSAAAPSKPKLLYQSDANVFRARQHAINYTVRSILRDFHGRGGWQPGDQAPQ